MENVTLADVQSARLCFVWGSSPAIQPLNAMVEEVARTDIPVLLMGESGTGKEVYGRRIHQLSKNCRKPLKKLSCRTLDQREFLTELKANLLTNGHASDGCLRTLFLDGIDELDLECQKFLLALLPDGETDAESHGHVRLITSACRNLDKDSGLGRFRRDLFFRISGVCLRLPALRDRREDIPALMEHFLAKHAAGLKSEVPILSDEEMAVLMRHNWPGNIRQLENTAKQIAAIGGMLALDKFDLATTDDEHWPQEAPNGGSLKSAARAASRNAERELIKKALERTHWNRKQAARDLQISYKSLLYKIRQTGLEGSRNQQAAKEGL